MSLKVRHTRVLIPALTAVLIVACSSGPTEAEIQDRIDRAVADALAANSTSTLGDGIADGRTTYPPVATSSEGLDPDAPPHSDGEDGQVLPVLSPGFRAPTGVDDALGVVSYGRGPRGNLYVLVVNATKETVWNLTVSATARDTAGSLVTTGYAGYMYPSRVPPGGIAFGRVSLSGSVLPDDLAFEFEIVVEGPRSSRFDLPIVEHAQTGDVIAATISNRSEHALTSVELQVMCIDEEGQPSFFSSQYAEQFELDPGQESSASVSVYDRDAQCIDYVATSTGWDI